MDEKIPRILLVDDDPNILSFSERVLRKLGYNVISHCDSKSALELFRDLPGHFNLIITDFKMPGLNGVEFSNEILKINPDIPIIICAGDGSIIDEDELKACGLKFFVRKPFLKNDFVDMISNALSIIK